MIRENFTFDIKIPTSPLLDSGMTKIIEWAGDDEAEKEDYAGDENGDYVEKKKGFF